MRTLEQKNEYLKELEQQRKEIMASVKKLRNQRDCKIADIRYDYNSQIREINKTKNVLDNRISQLKLKIKRESEQV